MSQNIYGGPVCFSVQKIDAVSGRGLAGAVLQLEHTRCGVTSPHSYKITDQAGFACFTLYAGNTYQLREITAPAGYRLQARIYSVTVSRCGEVWVDGQYQPCLRIPNILEGEPGPGPDPGPEPEVPASFSATKIDAESELGLAGVTFALQQEGQTVRQITSGADGLLEFNQIAPGTYELVETAVLPGYQLSEPNYQLIVSDSGEAMINGLPAEGYLFLNNPLFNLSFRKLDGVAGTPLAGVQFQLFQDGALVAGASSDTLGLVDLGLLPVGSYQLLESLTPAGYLPDTQLRQVLVGGDGTVTIDGTPTEAFVLENQPYPDFSFPKYVTNSEDTLDGATFELRQNGGSVNTAVSTDGQVIFASLAPGTYELVETDAPGGYNPDPTVYTVAVAEDGTILVEGEPAVSFSVFNSRIAVESSELPEINRIIAGDILVTGTGVPGCSLTVRFPNGTEETTAVDGSGDWVVIASSTLVAGQEVNAYQICAGKTASDWVSRFVIGPE